MSELHFIVHPTSQDLNEKIREVADKLNKYGSQTFPALNLIKVQVKQVVVGPAHLGILLEDGRALRVAYSVIPDRLDLSKPEKTTNTNGTTSNSNSNKNSPASRQLARTRARIIRASSSLRGSGTQASGSRSTGVIIGSASTGRSLVSVPTFVPEELVSQAQGVLQGKSRSLIIRELQRTNLDVNLAVNNLLSRDDEEGEDTEEGSDNYVPEDLISLLDGGFHSDNSVIIDADAMFSEDMFSGYSNIRNRARNERNSNNSSNTSNNDASGGSSVRGSSGSASASSSSSTTNPSGSSCNATSGQGASSGIGSSSSSLAGDRDAFGRWRDRQYFGPRKWFHPLRDESSWDKDDTKKKENNVPLWVSDELEYWPEREQPLRFSHIAALHSEFIGVSVKGELHQWRWADNDPYKNAEHPNVFHPRTLTLNLTTEKIAQISAASIRCSIATESGKIATWMDESLGYASVKLEYPATSYPEFAVDKITSLHTCTLYTVARTESNELFWWGVLPFGQRKRLWEKYKAKAKKPVRSNVAQSEIVVGSQVCMKNCPMYQPGAIGFTVVNGVPKVGQLLNAAWDLSSSCRFKIITMPTQSSGNTSGVSNLSDMKEFLKASASTSKQGSNSNSSSSNSNKETADRLDMPPPPSPASSTCSDTGSVSNKRQKRVTPKEEPDAKKDEELWLLKDVIFVEDVRSVPVGRVLKVDGAYAAVRFPTNTNSSSSKSTDNKTEDASADAWQDCRIMKKDDLQMLKSATTSRIPDCFQKTPRRIVLNSQLSQDHMNNAQLINFDIDTKGIHAILKTGNKLHYSMFNLNGRQEQDSVFPTDTTAFLGTSPNNVRLNCAGDSISNVILLRDGNNTLYPIAKDCVDAIKDPQWLDMPPVKCISAVPLSLPSSTTTSSRSFVAMIVLATESQLLMSRILRCDIESVKQILNQLENELKGQVSNVLAERIDGNRNILHACVSMCSPVTNKDTENDAQTSSSASGIDNLNVITGISTSNRPVSIREVMRRAISRTIDSQSSLNNDNPPPPPPTEDANSMPVVYWPPEYDPNSDNDDSLPGLNAHSSKNAQETYISDPAERRNVSVTTISLLCDAPALQPYLKQLLSAKDAHGQTPFMSAVSSRAYQAGIILFNAIMKIAKGDAALRDSMIFPPGSSADQSPLYVICCNDTCSFTWTGADHINQDIFECRTCGLTGSLCCCTECAKVCHKGHDCKLKKTSPTAYCDCWEKCKCKALIAGNQTKRFDLLSKLIAETDLVTRVNSRNEPILLFLIQTVGRQLVEQRQYRANSRVRSSSSSARKTPATDQNESEIPDHDLEPPRFARKALDKLLSDWASVRAMIMMGVAQEKAVKPTAMNQVFYEDADHQSTYLQAQTGTTLLDKFTHSLFVRCNIDPLDILLGTLVRELQNDAIPGRIEEAQKVTRRFVRSVARVFVIFSVEKAHNSDRQRTTSAQTRHILAYRKVFSSLHKYAIEELVEIADALISPVRMGVVRPTMPFSLSSSNMDPLSNADELFSVEPLAPSNRTSGILTAQASAVSTVDVERSSEPDYISRIRVRLREVDENNDNDATIHEDGDTSEQEEQDNNQSNAQQDDVEGQLRNEEAVVENESDTEYNFNEAETDSDSDDNQSTQDAQRSVQTGATAGSDTGLRSLISLMEDDSNDSSQLDDEGSDDNDSDDRSQEDLVFGEEQLERRTNSGGSQRSNLAPASMQWAIRNRDTTRQSGVRLTSSSNVVFIDPNALRRSTTSNAAVAAASQEPATMATTSSALARAFGIVLRQISELIGTLPDVISNTATTGTHCLYMTYGEAVHLQMYVERRLRPTLEWILTVMDSTEAQLRFGGSLTDSADPSHPLHPLNTPSNAQASTSTSNSSNGNSTFVIGSGQQRNRTTPSTQSMLNVLSSRSLLGFAENERSRDRNGNDASSSRRDFLTYCLSLMRSHNSEHRDSLPVLDITALRHVAYVLDALIFYMRSGNDLELEKPDSSLWDDQDENDNEDTEDEQSSSVAMDTDEEDNDLLRPSLGKRHSFFQRSESTLCLGCSPPDPFSTPMTDALPLADQPHLLTPNSRREELFAMPKSTQQQSSTTAVNQEAATESPLEYPPVCLGLSRQIRIQEDIPLPDLPPQMPELIRMAENDESRSEQSKPEVNHVAKMETEDSKKSSTNSRSSSPKPGPSREPTENELYFLKKTRHYYQKAEKDFDINRVNQNSSTTTPVQQQEEPQDLSHTSNNVMKMDVDELSEEDEGELSPYENATNFRRDRKSSNKDRFDENSRESNVRPPIIVTRKKVQQAIEFATATVLAKSKKNSLAECEISNNQPKDPDFELPNEFFELSDEDSRSSTHNKGQVSNHIGGNTNSSSPGKSVIVRAGASNSNELTIQQVETMETQEISAHVTVETTPTVAPSIAPELPMRGAYFREKSGNVISSDFLLRRWQVSLILFGRVFLEDVGMEPGSIISELGGFPVKETKFRRHMEKLRNAQQRDMTLSKMERNRTSLITQTFKELNTLYNNNNRRIQPPLAYGRVKVTFKDEPGEGSGVARSFYTSIAEALLANEKLPNLEAAQVGASKYSVPFSSMLQRHRSSSSRVLENSATTPSASSSSNRSRSLGSSSASSSNSNNVNNSTTSSSSTTTATVTTANSTNSTSTGTSATPNTSKPPIWRATREIRRTLSYDARPYRPANLSSADGASSSSSNDHLTLHQQQLGERLYPKVASLYPTNAPKITGMLLQLPPTTLLMLLGSDETFRQKTSEAMDILTAHQKSEGDASLDSSNNTSSSSKKINPVVVIEECQLDDNAPLFYSPGKRGFYSPRQGYPTYERINAFRNVGRLIGLCLLQNELLPLFLQRHVLKYILGRQIRFHDLAFFDPVLYESLRQLVKDSQCKTGGSMLLSSLELTFSIDLCPEEGGGTVELVPGGRDIQVQDSNVYDYVRKYAEYRMIKTQEKSLEAIRSGVFDVLPETALATLTAEDLRLLLNGVGDIHVGTLISYTTFNDESNENNEKLVKFKRWLWSVVEKMTNLERQDLVYFWTGSPALPASEDGFQPMPSVTIRPADDAHLPTANTCISRLYIPLYSSRAILRHKLLLAIKTKNFGFV
ncbi:E3 ubiquitin-protein ligase hyd isoform X2 [Culicoides brevitarsis]|uniref:E3 ubiquitin-protein ligase hyd isoform X2 n=1 Tax=Culicoides brevitarsis TaxID=469753 RepID=UPI00307BBAC3